MSCLLCGQIAPCTTAQPLVQPMTNLSMFRALWITMAAFRSSIARLTFRLQSEEQDVL